MTTIEKYKGLRLVHPNGITYELVEVNIYVSTYTNAQLFAGEHTPCWKAIVVAIEPGSKTDTEGFVKVGAMHTIDVDAIGEHNVE